MPIQMDQFLPMNRKRVVYRATSTLFWQSLHVNVLLGLWYWYGPQDLRVPMLSARAADPVREGLESSYLPAGGAFAATVAACVGRQPVVCGKPSPLAMANGNAGVSWGRRRAPLVTGGAPMTPSARVGVLCPPMGRLACGAAQRLRWLVGRRRALRSAASARRGAPRAS